MDTMTCSEFRDQLADTLDKVNDTHEPVLITTPNGHSVVLMGIKDFNAYKETAYLMKSTKNAIHLGQSIQEFKGGNTTKHKLIED